MKRKISDETKKKIGKEIELGSLLVLIVLTLIALYSIINYSDMKEDISYFIEKEGVISLFFIVLFLEFLPQIISPDFSLIFAIGMGMNIYLAVVVAIVASIIGSASAFLLGYHYGFDVIAPFFKEKTLNKIIRFWNKHGKWFVLASGTVPLPIPYFPLIFGSLRMKKKTFWLWGILPRALGFIVTGICCYYGFELVSKFV